MIGKRFLQLTSQLSNWCIISRYKYLFHTPCYSRKQLKTIEDELEISFKERYHLLNNELIGDFIYQHIIYNHLQFCPICISKGIHTQVHQLKTSVYCHIHQEQHLEEHCPSCGRKLLTNLLSSNKPFQCICGYKFLCHYSTLELLNYWEQDLPRFYTPAYQTKAFFAYPPYHADISSTFLSEMYYNNNENDYSHIIKQVFKDDNFQIKSSYKMLDKAYYHFKERLLDYNCPRKAEVLQEYRRLFLTIDVYRFKLLRHQKIDFLRYNPRLHPIRFYKLSDFEGEYIREYFLGFLNILPAIMFPNFNITQYNWIIYHFMMYLQYEVIQHIISGNSAWKPRPFLYQIDNSYKEYTIITVKYTSL